MTITPILFSAILAMTAALTDGLVQCYSCTSYMNQCKDIVAQSPLHVYHKQCSSKCFIRHGEDGAVYRGCFDDFVSVVYLRSNYTGCQNQTWNNRNLRWCFCSTELCNGVNMKSLESMTKSIPAQQYNALEKFSITTTPVILNTDHKLFKYLEDEEEGLTETGEENSKENMKEKGNVNEVTNHNKHDRNALKELKNDISFKKIPKPAQSLTEKWKSDPQKTWSKPKVVDNTANSIQTLKTDPKLAAKDRGLETIYYMRDADYPYNQDLQSVSKLMEALAKENVYEEPVRFNDKTIFRDKVSQQITGKTNIKAKPTYSELKEPINNNILPQLALQMSCEESGYYQHPTDCTLYMACIYDPFTQSPVWYLMRCPDLLFWDNDRKICVEFSINCPKTKAFNNPGIHI